VPGAKGSAIDERGLIVELGAARGAEAAVVRGRGGRPLGERGAGLKDRVDGGPEREDDNDVGADGDTEYPTSFTGGALAMRAPEPPAVADELRMFESVDVDGASELRVAKLSCEPAADVRLAERLRVRFAGCVSGMSPSRDSSSRISS
jgi:hypothetical protein